MQPGVGEPACGGKGPDADTIFSDTWLTNAPQNAYRGVNADQATNKTEETKARGESPKAGPADWSHAKIA